LELTNDITFDKNIKLEFENRAAKTVQRRLMREAEMAIA
jgi:hypothetical protein